MVLSVLNVQTAYAKALLVDRAALRERQQAQDVLGAHAVLRDAFETDVRPILAAAREEIGRPADPLCALKDDNIVPSAATPGKPRPPAPAAEVWAPKPD
jgi:L-rhamnose isomerase/sugar isomerase